MPDNRRGATLELTSAEAAALSSILQKNIRANKVAAQTATPDKAAELRRRVVMLSDLRRRLNEQRGVYADGPTQGSDG